MNVFRSLLSAGTLTAAMLAYAQQTAAPATPPEPTIRVTSKLVFLDVTVLDKKGRPVTTGLTQDDFKITENNVPQSIFSFEAPEAHTAPAESADAEPANPDSKAPLMIFVLDQLNNSMQDIAYMRKEAENYFQGQPKELPAPAELMVVGDRTLEMVQGWTRSRAEMLSAIQHLPVSLPFKYGINSLWSARLAQSLDALQQIALENAGTPGRKNIIWLGHGAPGLQVGMMDATNAKAIDQYIHATVNLLVDARISLFVVYPGMPPQNEMMNLGPGNGEGDVDGLDPYAGNVNFALFASQTGGKFLYNRNDVDGEMGDAQKMGTEYYTLTYQPHGGNDDGRFERIKVTMRDPSLHAITKTGYYAPDAHAPLDARAQQMRQLMEAARANVPFDTLPLKVSDVVRHPDSETAEFTVRLPAQALQWQAGDNNTSTTSLLQATASLGGDGHVLTSRVAFITAAARTDAVAHAEGKTIAVRLTVRVPKRARAVRVAMETEGGGRVGAAMLTRDAIDAAPATPTPPAQESH